MATPKTLAVKGARSRTAAHNGGPGFARRNDVETAPAPSGRGPDGAGTAFRIRSRAYAASRNPCGWESASTGRRHRARLDGLDSCAIAMRSAMSPPSAQRERRDGRRDVDRAHTRESRIAGEKQAREDRRLANPGTWLESSSCPPFPSLCVALPDDEKQRICHESRRRNPCGFRRRSASWSMRCRGKYASRT